MKWIKMGRIFSPDGNFPWMQSHAANPVAEYLSEDIFRIYFSCRDKHNRSSIGFIEFDINKPDHVLRVSNRPILEPGEPGLFDDSGASIGCLVFCNNKAFLYYTGWNLGVTVPWRNSIGLAIKNNSDKIFQKYSRVPIVDRSEVDPFSVSYPWVIQDGSVWKMWYGSNLRWGTEHQDMNHVIKYAESSDGIHWDRQGKIAIPLQITGEWGISKPCVIRDNDVYRMWYSYRGESYRIGYAESGDGIRWVRKDDEVGIDVSKSGWDSEMIEYPFVFDHDGERYMLYNGNGYGKSGIGLAVLAKE
jgi:predicted GH43/DUF377 family glycosyl hydrolase